MKKNILLKRVYEEPNKQDGARILVDRFWPRGIKKESIQIDEWMREISPSKELCKWYSHDLNKWEEFKKSYFKELNNKKDLCVEILKKGRGNLTLIFSSKDELHSNAAALKEYLEKNFK